MKLEPKGLRHACEMLFQAQGGEQRALITRMEYRDCWTPEAELLWRSIDMQNRAAREVCRMLLVDTRAANNSLPVAG